MSPYSFHLHRILCVLHELEEHLYILHCIHKELLEDLEVYQGLQDLQTVGEKIAL
jgi:hypothetical protein